jgi:transposase
VTASQSAARTCSPQRQRLGLSFRLYSHDSRTSDLLTFLCLLQRHLRCPLLLVLDRWSVRGAAVRRLGPQHLPWPVGVAWLPAYAPEMNPTEQVWNHTKYTELSNYLADDLAVLHEAVDFSLVSQRYCSTLLRSDFRYAQLKL